MAGQHNKIINAAAKRILAPEGLFRVGSSRTWIDDNGYFVIQVEFQPSSYDRGSYLNVGISFLWETSEGLNETLAFNIGYRVNKVGYVRIEEMMLPMRKRWKILQKLPWKK